jgi:hypothetical protein
MGKLRSKDGWSVFPTIIALYYTGFTLRLSTWWLVQIYIPCLGTVLVEFAKQNY